MISTSTLIDHVKRVDLRVQSIDRALAFYRDVVGLRVLELTEATASLSSPEGTVILALSSEGVEAPAERRATGLFHIAFRYPNRPALGDALQRSVSAGLEIGAGDHGVSEALYIDDPDGNGVELYRDRPLEEWPAPGPNERVRMYSEPVDLRALLDESGRAGSMGGEAPPGSDIGHVHLQVGDLAQTVDFYVDGLGLDLMTRLGDQAAFFSSNGYHHYIGANTWNSRGHGPAPRHHAGLERVVFQVADSEQLRQLQDRLAGTEGVVEHGVDGLIVRDPDGIELRLSAIQR